MTEPSNTYQTIVKLADEYPWTIQHRGTDHRRIQTFRWARDEHGFQYRHEVAILFDRRGIVSAWSEWHNYRQGHPDQEAGKKDRLIEHLTAAIEERHDEARPRP